MRQGYRVWRKPPALVSPYVTPDKRRSRADPGSMAQKPGSDILGSRIVPLARPVRDDKPDKTPYAIALPQQERDLAESPIHTLRKVL